MGRMVSAASVTAAQAAEGERKAKVMIALMLVGGLLLLTALLYFGSQFLQKTREKQSTLDEVNAITAQRDKEEAARRQKMEDEMRAAAKKDRDEEVARLTKMLGANVSDGDEKVAHELASELVTIETDLDKTFEDGTQPKNIPAYVEQRLAARLTGNEVLREWLGKRSPQDFARRMATILFGPPPDEKQ